MIRHKYFSLLRAESIALGLLCFTVIIWLAYEFKLDRTFVLDAKNPDFIYSVVTDRKDDGNSTAEITKTDSTIVVNFELKPGAPYPFVTLHLDPTFRKRKGINLSRYDKIRIWAKYDGPGNQRMRFHLRNFKPEYANESDTITLKYNEVQLPKLDISTPQCLSLQHFQVPGWWIAKLNIPFEHGKMDVTNVWWIQLLTPELAPSGKGLIELRKIEFRGKLIPPNSFFKGLLVFWMIVWAAYSFIRIAELMQLLKRREEREKELLNLNQVLSIQKEEFKLKAHRDALTGLLNRHGIRDKLYQALENVRENKQNLSAIFVDIDYFKKINDTLGHPEGDRILHLTATVLRENTRESDIVARWGGEEFLIITHTDLQSAKKMAEKLRQLIANLPDNITCSFGVSSISECNKFQTLITRVDKALYEAKRRGRNCVVCVETDL